MAGNSDGEPNPFKVAMEADKRAGRGQNLLHQKLAAKEQEVRQTSDKLRAADRQIKSLTTQLSEQKQAYRDVSAKLEELKEQQEAGVANKFSQTEQEDPASPVPSGPLGGIKEGESIAVHNQHDALAAKLLEGGLENLDGATVAAAAKGLRDTAVLESQLLRARAEIERLQKEIQHLNDTVFSKTFKAPSAWADRELKYKMEKRSWEVELQGFKEQVKTLQEENEGYRAANRAAEFEQNIQELKLELKRSKDEKVAAQQALHELQLEMRELSVRAANSNKVSPSRPETTVHSRVSRMEDQAVGPSHLSPKPNGIAAHHSRQNSVDASVSYFQETLRHLDDQKVGVRTPPFPSRKSTLSRASTRSGVLPDARANEEPDLLSTGEIDVEALADEYESHAKNAGEGYQPKARLLEDDGAAADRAVKETTPDSKGPKKREEVSPDISHNQASEETHASSGTVVEAVLAHAEGVPSGMSADVHSDSEAGAKRNDESSEAQTTQRTDVPADPADVRHDDLLPEVQAREGAVTEAVLSHPEGGLENQSERTIPSSRSGPAANVSSQEPTEVISSRPKSDASASVEGQSSGLHARKEGGESGITASESLQQRRSQDSVLAQPSAGDSGDLSINPLASADRSHASAQTSGRSEASRLDEASGQSTSEVNPGSSLEAVPSTEAPNIAQQEPPAAKTSQAVEDQAQQQAAEIDESSAAVQSQASTRKHAEDEAVSPASTVLPVAADGLQPSTATSAFELQASDSAKERPETASPLQGGTGSVEAKVRLESVNEVQEELRSPTEASQSPADTANAQEEGSKSQESVHLSTAEIQPVTEASPETRVAAENLEDTPAVIPAPMSAASKKGDGSSQLEYRAREQTGEVSRIAVSGINEGRDSADSSSPFDEAPATGVAPQKNRDSALREGIPSAGSGAPSGGAYDFGHLQLSPDLNRSASQKAASGPRGPSLDMELAQNRALIVQASRQADEKLILKADEDTGSPWTQEKLQALEAQREATEAELEEHFAEQDVTILRRRNVEMATRIETHEAQIQKMQKALEAADQEKAKLEEDLDVAMQAAQRRGVSGEEDLNAIRDRMRNAAQQGEVRSKELENALQDAHRENARLEKAYNELRKQLANIASKLGSGMIPDDADLQLSSVDEEEQREAGHLVSAGLNVPLNSTQMTMNGKGNLSGSGTTSGSHRSISGTEGAAPIGKKAGKPPARARTAKSGLVRHGSNFASMIGGLSDEEMEVMNLREENSKLMDTLVATKVSLAETQGDYLKMRRGLIRAVEKQASHEETLENVETAANAGNLSEVQKILTNKRSLRSKLSAGDVESLGERTKY